MEALIRTEGLTKFYGKARGVVELDLEVMRGEVFGFIGPNGAGKSTTIRLLLGLLSPTRGRAEALGLDCLRDRAKIAQKTGYMPSESTFYPNMRAGEIIRFAAKLHGRDCSREAKSLCERFEVDEHKKIDALSLGNRRKVSLVCAFQHEPELLILDEPISGLDPLMQKAFFDLLHERNERGATVFLSSHVLSVVQRHCRRAGVVREGRLIACDAVDALTRTAARRVHLLGVSEPPNLPGIRDVRAQEGEVSFLYTGEPPALVEALRGLPLADMTVTEPDLDEIFLHFYGSEGAEKGGDAR